MTQTPAPDSIDELKQSAITSLSNLNDLHSLEEWRVEYLGRRGYITNFLKDLSNVPIELRREKGSAGNSLKQFLEDSEEYIISEKFSNLVVHLDSASSYIHKNGLWLYLAAFDSLANNGEILDSIKITSLDSINMPIGRVLRAYQDKSIGIYRGFKFIMGNNLYNYSNLSIQYDSLYKDKNPRIDLMYTK